MGEDAFAGLVARVGAFHITDRAMRQAQDTATAALANGTIDEEQRKTYRTIVQRYFSAFQREARTHLRDVDQRLERLNQLQFNLVAERGVAVKRIEATQSVLAELDTIGAGVP
jgi:hypothetical protein